MEKIAHGIFRAVLCLFVCLSLVSVAPVRAQTVVDIATAEELDAIRADLAGSYRLTADIDLSSISNWTPLGDAGTPFTGVFDGGDHTIRNLTIANTQDSNQGLFGVIGATGWVSNLKVEGARVTAADNAGILAGDNQGTLYRVAAEGIISGATVVGGLVGLNSGDITAAYAIAAVSGSNYNGGLAGSNSGTLTSVFAAASVSGAVTNTYLQFDGENDYISIPENGVYISDSFTLEAWFRWTEETDREKVSFITGKGYENFEIHTGGGSGENGIRFIPVLNTSTLVGTKAYQDVPYVLQPGWNHVAASWDYTRAEARVFLNGIPQDIYQDGVKVGLVGSIPLVDSSTNPLAGNENPFFIGARNVNSIPSLFFLGNIADVRFWNTVRTPEEIAADKDKQLAGNEPGLIGYWKLDETSGSTVIDSSPTGNNGTIIGATRIQEDSTNGGLVAANTGTVTDGYYDSGISGLNEAAPGITPLTTGQMMTQAAFTGWDFTSLWRMDEGSTYPTLFMYTVPIRITGVSPSPAPVDQPYTVSVEADPHFIGQPAGPVTIADGEGHTCQVTLTPGNPAGQCELTTSTSGGKTLTASFGGTAVFNPVSDTHSLEVIPPPPLTVTVNQAAGQADPTSAAPVHFTVVFNQPIQLDSFLPADVTLAGDAGATTAAITQLAPNDNTTFDLAVSGMTGPGAVAASIGAGKVFGPANQGNTASTAADNQVTFTDPVPTVTVNQASGQADPAHGSPVHFTAEFSEPIDLASFDAADVTLSGTAGAAAVTIAQVAPNDGTTFELRVSGMTGPGTVVASIAAGRVLDLAHQGNAASTFSDNTVTFTGGAPTVTSLAATGYRPSLATQAWTVTVTVGSDSGTPTGTVTLKAGASTLGTLPLVGGTATFDVQSLGGGTHHFTAEYSGANGYAGSTSAPLEVQADYFLIFPLILLGN